jgi:hypothetical protein
MTTVNRMIAWKTWAAAAALLAAQSGAVLAPAFAAALSAADRQWIATCMKQLANDNHNRTVVRKYCTCMHDIADDNAPYTQSELEHSFPPAHLMCNKESGWR